MFWKYQKPKTRASFLRFLGLVSMGCEISPSSDTAFKIWFLGFGENSKGCVRNLLKDDNFVVEWWIWDMGLKESLELWWWNLLRRFGDALIEKWWFGLVKVTEEEDALKDNIFKFVAVLDEATKNWDLRQWVRGKIGLILKHRRGRNLVQRRVQVQLWS